LLDAERLDAHSEALSKATNRRLGQHLAEKRRGVEKGVMPLEKDRRSEVGAQMVAELRRRRTVALRLGSQQLGNLGVS
jgi:hypothetical protein